MRVYPHKKLCDDKSCLIYANGKALYNDDDHLSSAGAEFVLSEFEPIFAGHGLLAASADTNSALAAREGSGQH